MFRARRALSPVDLAWRLLAPLLVASLALSTAAVEPAPVAAGSSGSIATLRQRQVQAETAMRRADKQIERLLEQRRKGPKLIKASKRRLRAAVQQRDAIGQKADKAHARLDRLTVELGRSTRVRPDPRGKQVVDKPALRKRVRKAKAKVAVLDRRVQRAERRTSQMRKLKRLYTHKVTKVRIRARRLERERAEQKLGAAIERMTALAKGRADNAHIASARGFRKPVAGKISQPYGCTGYHTNGRRGSCRYFHDGVDIAARRGTRIRASADGYVAYAGFSPWDAGARAFVVIIGHARGYSTVYAHLQPTRMVRTGQRVERGDVIGAIGLTGLTSGPHVHWEAHRGSRTVDPRRAGR